MGSGATIVWFRQDLRLRDHIALARGVDRGGAVVPVFCWWPEGEGRWPAGAASRWWLHRSLAALQAELGARGSRLVIRRGDPAVVLPQLAREVGAEVVAASRRYEPAARSQDEPAHTTDAPINDTTTGFDRRNQRSKSQEESRCRGP